MGLYVGIALRSPFTPISTDQFGYPVLSATSRSVELGYVTAWTGVSELQILVLDTGQQLVFPLLEYVEVV